MADKLEMLVGWHWPCHASSSASSFCIWDNYIAFTNSYQSLFIILITVYLCIICTIAICTELAKKQSIENLSFFSNFFLCPIWLPLFFFFLFFAYIHPAYGGIQTHDLLTSFRKRDLQKLPIRLIILCLIP